MGISIFAGPNADITASALAILAQKAAQELSQETNWAGIRLLVHNGLGPKSFPIGTQIADEWKRSADSEPLTAIWDVVNHAADGMELNWHYALPDKLPFDAPEALYYAPAGGLPAGQYYITVSKKFANGWIVGQHINFTLSNAMDAGDQLVVSMAESGNVNPTNGRPWNVYAKGSTTSKDSGTTSDSDAGTELGSTHATDVYLPNGQINSPARVVYGYSRYSQSAIRQYLNSAADAGGWWTAQNPWDRPPIALGSVRGLLAGFDPDFVGAVDETEVVTALCDSDATAESKTTDITYDKIYLPSLDNLYVGLDISGEGDEWEYYKELATEVGLDGRFEKQHAYPALKKYNLSNQTSPISVWLRSCNKPYSYYPWYLNGNGTVNYTYGPGGDGGYAGYSCVPASCCPACKIKSN